MFARRDRLPGLRPQGVQVGGEHVVGAEQALDRHRRGDVGDDEQLAQVVQGEAQHPEHAVGAVDEGQALLLLELDGRDAGRGQGVGGRHPLAVHVADLALTHEGQRAVRERREVAGAAERAVLVHHRRDARVEHRHVGGQGLLADAGAPGRQGRDAQQHERPHDLALDLGAGAGGVRADQRALQLVALLDRDVPGGQGAEAGRDAVVRLGVVRQPADHLAGAPHLGQGLVGEAHRGAVAGDPHDVLDGERAGADAHRLDPGPGVDADPGGCRAVRTRVRRGQCRECGLRSCAPLERPAGRACTGSARPYRLGRETMPPAHAVAPGDVARGSR